MAALTYTVWRQCITGANLYGCYQGKKLVCSASTAVLPSFPVTITTPANVLEYRQNPGQTIVPGCKNTVFSGKKRYAQVVYLGQGTHALQMGKTVITVSSRDGVWRFFQGEQLLAVLSHAKKVRQENWELRLGMTALEAMDPKILPLMLNFPLLQIGL